MKQITTNFENSLGKIPTVQTPSNIQNPYKPVTQDNSLKKLVAGLNSVQQKSKTENILNTLKKNSENKLLSESKKSFLGIDRNKNEKPKEVTTSWLSAFCSFVKENEGVGKVADQWKDFQFKIWNFRTKRTKYFVWIFLCDNLKLKSLFTTLDLCSKIDVRDIIKNILYK